REEQQVRVAVGVRRYSEPRRQQPDEHRALPATDLPLLAFRAVALGQPEERGQEYVKGALRECLEGVVNLSLVTRADPGHRLDQDPAVFEFQADVELVHLLRLPERLAVGRQPGVIRETKNLAVRYGLHAVPAEEFH